MIPTTDVCVIMIRVLLLILSVALAAELVAQKYSDSLLLHIPVNSTVNDNGPAGYAPTSASITYSNDTRGNVNQAVTFNGTSSRVTYATAGTAFQHALPLTVSTWVNLNSITGNNPVFYSNDNYSRYAGVWIQIIDGFIYANVGDGIAAGSGNRFSVKSASALTASTWVHICAVFSSSNVIDLYINGVKDLATTASGTNVTMGWNTTSNTSLGSANIGAGTYAYLNGKIDNLMVWGRALSDVEVKLNKDLVFFGDLGAASKDFGPASNTITKTGTTADVDRMGNTGSGLLFNGNSDKIALPANATYKPAFPVTLSAWVYIETSTGTLPIVNTTDHSSGVYAGASLWIDNGFPTIYVGDASCNGGTCRRTYVSNDAITNGRWTLITAVLTNISTYKIYINGNAISGGVLSGTGAIMGNSASVAGTIGYLTDSYGALNKYFKGIIDEVSIINSAFTATDVTSMFSNSVYVKQQPSSTTVAQNTAASLTCKGIGTAAVTYQWQKKGNGNTFNNLSGATAATLSYSTLQAADTGDYQCVIISGGKQVTTNAAHIGMTVSSGINQPIHTMHIYPNPAKNELSVTLDDGQEHQIKIFDLQGRVILNETSSSKNTILDISTIPAGSYVITCLNNSGLSQNPLLIVR